MVVPFAGALVGMLVQWFLLFNKPDYRFYVIANGITSRDPITWVLVGAPLGALPAFVAAGLLSLALQVTSRVPSQDARERMLVPLVGGCAVLHAIAVWGADGIDLILILCIIALAVLGLVAIYSTDKGRIAWLQRVFAHDDPAFTLQEPAGSRLLGGLQGVPPCVGGILPRLLIVGHTSDRGYRDAAAAPVASAAETLELTLAPVLSRQRLLRFLLLMTVLTTAIALAGHAYPDTATIRMDPV
jgi:hypothetical protein